MLDAIKKHWNTYYIGLLCALAAYSVAFPNQEVISFLAYYAFSYVSISTLALAATGLAIFAMGIFEVDALDILMLPEILALLVFLSSIPLIYLLAGLGSPLQGSFFTPAGLLAFALSLWSIVQNPQQRVNLFPENLQKRIKIEALEKIAVELRKIARALVSAALPGFFLSLFIWFAYVHASPGKESLPVAFIFGLFFAPAFIGEYVIERHKQRIPMLGNSLVQGAVYIAGIAIFIVFSLLLDVITYSFANGFSFEQKLSAVLAFSYACYALMHTLKFPKWFFDPALKGQDLEAFRNALLPEDRKKIDYAKVGQKVIIEQYGRKYAVEKKESDIRITPLEE